MREVLNNIGVGEAVEEEYAGKAEAGIEWTAGIECG